MKLSYFDLLSPSPVVIPDICSIISPKLKDIAAVGSSTYQYYLSLLLMNIETYFKIIGHADTNENIIETDSGQMNLFNILFSDEKAIFLFQSALQFFIYEKIVPSQDNNCFIVYDKNERRIGMISSENYTLVCDVIRQRNHFQSDAQEDLSKIKNKKALEIAKKLQQGRTKKKALGKTNDNMELGNIISAVANKSQSLNILNIWDLTIYQLWDCFLRLTNNTIYDIQSMSVAAWGDKDKHFDVSSWYKRIKNEF